MENELKPCPFCGGEAVVIDNGCFVDVSCKNFHCRGWADSLMYKSKEEAIEAWNRRCNDGTYQLLVVHGGTNQHLFPGGQGLL